jgi:hypothetical protein
MNSIKKIADRARQFEPATSRGNAIMMACAEFGEPENAELVRAEMDNQDIASLAAHPGLARTLGNLSKGQGKRARRARRMIREGHDVSETANF